MKRFPMIGLALTMMLAGCGGGGGGGDDDKGSGGAADGAYFGSTSNDYNTLGLVLDDGTYWFIYVTSSSIGGGVQGTGTYHDDGSFTSSNGLDFHVGEDIYDVDVDAKAVAKTSLNGTLNYDDGSKISFSSDYDPGYELTPSLSTLTGTYTGLAATSEGEEQASATISSSGAISGTSASGCTFSGSAKPRAHGNVYDVSISFGGGVCTNGTDTVKGVAYYDASSQLLVSAAVNSGRSDGFIFVASK